MLNALPLWFWIVIFSMAGVITVVLMYAKYSVLYEMRKKHRERLQQELKNEYSYRNKGQKQR